MTDSRILLITGGSRGIGAAVAVQAAARGYDVAVNYRNDARAAHEIVRRVEQHGRRAVAVQADVALEGDVLRLFETVDRSLGRLSALVNNAGVVDVACKVADMSVARLQRMFGINLLGSFLCAREAVRRMARSRGGQGGVIVNVSSAAARLGSPGEYVDYAASKAAVDALTLGLGKEVAGDGIRVNGVRPGLIQTEIHASGGEPDRLLRLVPNVPMQRAGEASEVAEAIVWLLSDAASYMTAATIDVAGGR